MKHPVERSREKSISVSFRTISGSICTLDVMLTECILHFPETGRTSEIQNGDDGAAQHTSAGRKLGITCGGEEKWEVEEEGPLTQIEGDTFRVAGDGRWWKERRADGGRKKNEIARNVFIIDARLASCAGAISGGRGGIPKAVGNIAF